MVGYCDNPKSYYYGEPVKEDFEAEECGYTRCGNCPYFYNPDNDPTIQRSRYLLSRIKIVRTELKALKKALEVVDDEEEKELIKQIISDLEKEERDLEEQIKEHRRDLIMSEKAFPF